ncbi:uncharacterized protein LOC110719240 [Chenopodium quinoa]|uniref:uncharacterized protein LOC110719240 n=1 Tax=Chenopodium quinoa TaxID=63459 RepID=UPI000B77CCEE|nr:uncharacterized protein LOC110719240 [Chenopodium quinoa]
MALQRPPKLKHFLWRACKGFLAVKERRLFYRHVVSEKSCSICSSLDETIIHSTFKCATAKEIWAASSFMAQINVAPARSFVERFMWILKNELVTKAALAWASWYCRNKHIFEQDGFNVVEVAKSWVDLAYESNAYAIKVINRTAPTVGPSPSSWSCPSAGTVKVNCDAYLGAKTGLGVVIKSEHGHLLGAAIREEYGGWNVEATRQLHVDLD